MSSNTKDKPKVQNKIHVPQRAGYAHFSEDTVLSHHMFSQQAHAQAPLKPLIFNFRFLVRKARFSNKINLGSSSSNPPSQAAKSVWG